jgi:hypothetical protein
MCWATIFTTVHEEHVKRRSSFSTDGMLCQSRFHKSVLLTAALPAVPAYMSFLPNMLANMPTNDCTAGKPTVQTVRGKWPSIQLSPRIGRGRPRALNDLGWRGPSHHVNTNNASGSGFVRLAGGTERTLITPDFQSSQESGPPAFPIIPCSQHAKSSQTHCSPAPPAA